nr:unnamed protein product [Spirometra erinaceieuropaei]
MKHDPSISIDDIISKMLTIPAPRQIVSSENTENSGHSNLTSSTDHVLRLHTEPFTPFVQGLQSSQSNFEENGSLAFSNTEWDFGVPQSSAVPVAASNSTADAPTPFDDDDNEFGSFTSCEPGLLPPASTAPSLEILASVTNGSPPPQLPSPSPDDTFQDFQGCPAIEPEAFQQTEEEGPLKDWLRCLDACLTMLTDSEAVLSALTTDEGVNAFLATPRGYEFVFELIEIYGIVQRIRMASTLYNVLNLRLQSTFKQIDKVWSNLAHFVKTDSHKAALRRLLTLPGDSANQGLTEFTQPAVDDKQLCGVCVTPVTLLPNSIIELAGHVYHPSCANLWVNKIQLSLPALCRP